MIVQTVITDMEFDRTIEKLIENLVVNTSSVKEHISEIERTIVTFKERTRCIVTSTTFKYLHNLLTTKILFFFNEQTPSLLKMEH